MTTPRTIVIVGGVAGGASAAARARRTNEQARITVIERGPHASFANCGLPYYVGGEITERDRLLLARPERFRDWLNVELRTGHEAIAIEPIGLLLAVRDLGHRTPRGARMGPAHPRPRRKSPPPPAPRRPRPEGLHPPGPARCRTDRTPPWPAARARAVVVGAGYIGLELAEMLVRRGLGVTLVERFPRCSSRSIPSSPPWCPTSSGAAASVSGWARASPGSCSSRVWCVP